MLVPGRGPSSACRTVCSGGVSSPDSLTGDVVSAASALAFVGVLSFCVTSEFTVSAPFKQLARPSVKRARAQWHQATKFHRPTTRCLGVHCSSPLRPPTARGESAAPYGTSPTCLTAVPSHALLLYGGRKVPTPLANKHYYQLTVIPQDPRCSLHDILTLPTPAWTQQHDAVEATLN